VPHFTTFHSSNQKIQSTQFQVFHHYSAAFYDIRKQTRPQEISNCSIAKEVACHIKLHHYPYVGLLSENIGELVDLLSLHFRA